MPRRAFLSSTSGAAAGLAFVHKNADQTQTDSAQKSGNVYRGINLEFVRHEDKPFEWAVDKAAE